MTIYMDSCERAHFDATWVSILYLSGRVDAKGNGIYAELIQTDQPLFSRLACRKEPASSIERPRKPSFITCTPVTLNTSS